MQRDTWLKYNKKLELNEPIAIVGSPGLRSLGILVIDSLIKRLKPQLMAELYSTHFPLIYQTQPSYASNPKLPGIGGVRVEKGKADFPKVQFYAHTTTPLIITRGYHANFEGQYEIAENVLDFFNDHGVKKIIILAGYGFDGEEVYCAATSQKILEEMKKNYGITMGYEGPFYGFSGLVFGLARLRKIEALCLFGRTKPFPEDPQRPDDEASKNLLNKLVLILNLTTQ